MNTITIPSFRVSDLINKYGKYQADLFVLMWTTRLYNTMGWRNGWFTFQRPKDSKSKFTIEQDAQRTHDGLYNFLVKVIEYNIKNK